MSMQEAMDRYHTHISESKQFLRLSITKDSIYIWDTCNRWKHDGKIRYEPVLNTEIRTRACWTCKYLIWEPKMHCSYNGVYPQILDLDLISRGISDAFGKFYIEDYLSAKQKCREYKYKRYRIKVSR